LMNWLLQSFSAEQLPDTFTPHTAGEVAVLRENPERDPETVRLSILSDLAATVPGVADKLETERPGRR
ncbi:MAG: hypothetical protein ACR2QR_05715, partial [Woeseiaceae bacterium]